MSLLRSSKLGYRFAAGGEVGPLDLEVQPGEIVLLRGPSGCGKSTLLRLCAGIRGAGETLGEVTVQGEDPSALAPARRAALVGYVGQEPLDALVAGTLGEELAFAAHNAGRTIDVGAELARAGLPPEPERSVAALSGGQLQRLVTAAALSGGARLLLLDEPLAWLDAAGARALAERLRALAAEGVGVVVAEHRPFSAATRVVELAPVGAPPAQPRPAPPLGATVLSARGVRTPWALDGLDLDLRVGERLALVGPNGAGKTTLLRALAGQIPGGTVKREGRVILVPQDPDLALISATVAEELAMAPGELGLAEDPSLLSRLGLEGLEGRSPHGLSRGQRQRLAVGAALAARPAVLLLDEPTAGQDPASVDRLLESLGDSTLIFASHDEELVRRHATRVLRVEPRATPTAAPAPAGPEPRVGLLLLVAVGLLSLLLERPASLGVLTLVCGLALPRALWGRALVALALLTWSTALSQGLFYADLPRTPWITVGGISLWREGVFHGLEQSQRFGAAALAGMALAARSGPDRLLSGLRGLGVNPGLSMLIAAGLRLLPQLGELYMTARQSRAARARPTWRRSPPQFLASELALLRPVVARALRRARALGESLESRGWDPQRPAPATPPLLAIQAATLAAVGLAVTAVAVCRTLFWLYTSGAWYHPSLRPLLAFTRAWL